MHSSSHTKRTRVPDEERLGYTGNGMILDGALPPQAVLDRCTRLWTLVFAGCPTGAVKLPATSRRVGYHVVLSEMAAPSADVQFLVRALRLLRELSMVTTTRALSPPAVDELRLGCEEMHVEFALYCTTDAFRSVKDLDWI
ncbi:hypothetical protein FA95DRAFT_1607620 [Auriscalpium vulgare]|uniref:Uncharacterized protein n=1 Tax=Auriscalpium vulgare TaxID=40419 RepID=A0ACB8RN21_9AGAM|nr:hypothetical protein FA95DRAFT_1607620 [Auriscalpium vulgare]